MMLSWNRSHGCEGMCGIETANLIFHDLFGIKWVEHFPVNNNVPNIFSPTWKNIQQTVFCHKKWPCHLLCQRKVTQKTSAWFLPDSSLTTSYKASCWGKFSFYLGPKTTILAKAACTTLWATSPETRNVLIFNTVTANLTFYVSFSI